MLQKAVGSFHNNKGGLDNGQQLFNNSSLLMSDILLIQMSATFDVDLCVIFLIFHVGVIWNDLVNKLPL